LKVLVALGAEIAGPTEKPSERRRRWQDGEAGVDDMSGIAPVATGGPGVYPIHAASGVGFGKDFAAISHRHVPDGWLAAVKYLVEEQGADVNARDYEGFTPLHHAASRGDVELIRYLVDHGADVTALSRKGQTTADMANGPVQRVQPFPEAVELLMSLGSKNSNKCLSC
jgi:ankyrin repeat protein